VSKKKGDQPRKCKHESFVIEEVHRSQITNAPWNPRRISTVASEKLKKNLKQIGLTHPLTWNRRTGHLLAGHQRLSILDSLERTQDYVLSVSVVDLDEAVEKQQNVFENNTDAQGEFDDRLMRELIKEPTFDTEAAGIDLSEVVERHGEDVLAASSEKLKALSAALEAAKARQTDIQSKSDETNVTNFYRVVVFKDAKEAEKLSAFNEEHQCIFLHGGRLLERMGIRGE
jgi:hypothetical protein